MGTPIEEAKAIRSRMALLRRDLDSEVRTLIANGESVTDWRRYVSSHPWPFITAAALAGYLLVPKRARAGTNHTKAKLPTGSGASGQGTPLASERVQPSPPIRSGGILGTAWEILYPVAIRAVQSYAVRQIEEWIDLQHRPTARSGNDTTRPSDAPGQMADHEVDHGRLPFVAPRHSGTG